MEDGSGGRSRRYETNGSLAGLTLSGILSIKQTPPYRIHARTLLDLICDDQTCGKESKKSWKMFQEKLRLKLSGSVCTTTGPTLASHVHITTDSNRMPTRSVSVSVSPPVNDTSSVPDTQTVNLQTEMPMAVEEHVQPLTEENRVADGDGGEPDSTPMAVKMSLMSLLEVEASAYLKRNQRVKETRIEIKF